MVDFNALITETLKYGFPGVVIIVLAWVLYQSVKEFKAEMKAKDAAHAAEVALLRKEKDEVQEKRIAEGRESLVGLNNTTNVLQDVLAAMSSLQNGKAG